ncbi:MAG: Succinyl-CoA--L-malate CoA-transferase alpha subunit [Alphaproteobacteria bacterium MarineAlpha4_Bin2]|nr:MAG: Succinyl-CoA--L-malate CoA-transferase alpha subunit [Alphaproteobacteria bacterium MarineAlpha4_Bin2]
MTDCENNLPLDGIRILDIATFVAAPFASTILSEFGAEVIKVENPKGGDPWRHYGTKTARDGDTLAWMTESRNKSSVTLDLRTPEGVDILKRLVAISDVICENFRPGTLERWGLGPDVLHDINPELVLLRVSGYGQTGPYKQRPGFARIAQAFGGLTYLAGMPDGPPVTPGSTSLADYTSGLYGAIGILIALKSRDRTGEGQVIDMALYESIFRFLDELVPAYAKEGTVRQREGMGTKLACPHGHFQTGDDKWVSLACTSDRMFERLAKVMGRPELSGPDMYQTTSQRISARETVDGLVTEFTRSYRQSEVLQKCTDGDVPCGAINSVADIFEDPQFEARDNLLRFDDSVVGEIVIPGVIPKLSKTPGRVKHIGPPIGDGIDFVYGELLGLSSSEIADLKTKGVI